MRDFSLKTSDRIGVFAPSSYVEAADIDAAVALMMGKGFDVFVHPQTFERHPAPHGQLGGTAAQKVEALHDLYRDPSIDVIWAAGGGNRALQIIDALDYDLIRANPKPMIGFSDVTALLNAIAVRAGVAGIHGPVFKGLPRYSEIDALLAGDFEMSLSGADVINHGVAEGVLFGGNLSLFQYLPQTLGDFMDGAILLLEDCHEEISRIDRMLLQLRRIGVFGQIGGLVLGDFTDMQDSARPFGLSLEGIVREHVAGFDIPVVMGAPFGHGGRLYPCPIGSKAILDTRRGVVSMAE